SFFSLYHTSTTAIYTLSLHDALPISHHRHHVLGDLHLLGLPAPLRADTRGPGERDPPLRHLGVRHRDVGRAARDGGGGRPGYARSEEHTSELQSRGHLVCRLLLEKKK